tara:strand:- start:90 stop:302 length:213 start_codon:yes stop_codon:yes gene_type:complete
MKTKEKEKNETYQYECILNLGKVYPCRYAKSKEEFINNLLDEYNTACNGLFDVRREDISKITSDEETDNE